MSNTDVNDIEDPDWEPFTVDGMMTFDHDKHGLAGILTIHGVMDLMHHLKDEAAEELKHWFEGGMPEHEIPGWLRQVLPADLPPPVDVRADINPARRFATTTFPVPAAAIGQSGGATLLSARSDRIRAVVTNAGANPAWLSWTDAVNNINTAGEMEWISLPNGALPGNPREIRARGKIYAYSTLGTLVDVQDEYGLLRRESIALPPSGG